MEHDWRPRDAAERSRTDDRVDWHHQNHADRVRPKTKDELFRSQEAIDFDRGVTQSMDPANRTWVPLDRSVPEYDEEPKP